MNFQQFNYNKKKKTASICHIQLRTEREKKLQKTGIKITKLRRKKSTENIKGNTAIQFLLLINSRQTANASIGYKWTSN